MQSTIIIRKYKLFMRNLDITSINLYFINQMYLLLIFIFKLNHISINKTKPINALL